MKIFINSAIDFLINHAGFNEKNKKIAEITYFSITVLCILSACRNNNEYHIYVNPIGDDHQTGTEEQPVASIEKALGLASDYRMNHKSPIVDSLENSNLLPENSSQQRAIVSYFQSYFTFSSDLDH